MGKRTPDVVTDAALDKVATGTTMCVCSAEPMTRAEAVSTYMIASVTMTPGDFVKAAGDVSGRKVTMAQKAGVSISSSGTANHVVIVDGTQVLDVTTCTPQALTAGGTVTIGTWKHEIQAAA